MLGRALGRAATTNSRARRLACSCEWHRLLGYGTFLGGQVRDVHGSGDRAPHPPPAVHACAESEERPVAVPVVPHAVRWRAVVATARWTSLYSGVAMWARPACACFGSRLQLVACMNRFCNALCVLGVRLFFVADYGILSACMVDFKEANP